MTIPTALLYAAACVVATGLNLAPRDAFRGRDGRELPVEMRHIGRRVMEFASALLCSGSYVLCDVRVPAAKVKVRITLI